MVCVETLIQRDESHSRASYHYDIRPLPAQKITGRTLRLVAEPSRAINGWPESLDSAIAWDGSKLQSCHFTHALSTEEIGEIEAALEYFKGLGLPLDKISQANFPLPQLAEKLCALATELHTGRGFFALRGLNSEQYSPEDNAIIFLGVSAYVGEKRGIQNDAGHIFAHIREAKSMPAGQNDRPIRDSSKYSPFHTDSFGDVLAIQVRSRADRGGNHLLASTARIYNELVATRPELLPILAAPNWYFDTRGSLTPPSRRALLYYHNGKVIMNLNRDPLLGRDGLPRSENMPTATGLQREALDVVQALAVKYQCALNMEPGDLTFANNLSTLHAREAFEDSPTASRYLVRLWLKNTSLTWSLPSELEEGNSRSFCNQTIPDVWNVLSEPRLQFSEAEMMTP